MNSYYDHTTYPNPNAPGASAALRAELNLIEAGFDKLPTLAGNAGKLVRINDAGTALEAGGTISSIDFALTGVADAVARLTWNDTDGTLNLGLKGGNVVLQVGQEQVLRGYNNSGSAMTEMQVVYISGSSGQRPVISLAQANSEVTSSKTIGVLTENIANNSEGFVNVNGLINNVNTSTLTEGAVLWLSATVPGGLTTTRPAAPLNAVVIGYCIRSHSTQGKIFVNVQNGYELEELHDVLITSIANNNMLKWDSSSGVWKNVAGPAGTVVGTTDTQTLTNKTISGGTVTGAVVTGLGTPSGSTDAATKGYVDTADALKLNLSGGTMSGAIAMNTSKITGLGTPTADTDAATKAYVDGVAQGLDIKTSVAVATTGNITLSGTQTVDGVALIAGQRVLVKDQTAPAENGIYLVAAGSWTRPTDMDAWTEFPGAFVFVEQGTVNDNSGWVCTVAPGGTLGSTAVTFEQFSGAGQITAGAGMTKSGNTLNVVTASSARIVVNADNIDLATTGVSASTYRSVTVDTYGRVTAGTNPTTISGYGITDAYTKTQVDGFVNAKLNLSGGTMSGNIAMGGTLVTGLGAPSADNDAVRLKYVTDLFGSTASAASSAADALTYKNAAESAATTATTQAGIATTGANTATTQAGIATTQAGLATTAANSAAASYDSFDDRYLGPKASAPTVDNDGNPLLTGALYWNSTSNNLWLWTGSAWTQATFTTSGFATLTGTETLTNKTLTAPTISGLVVDQSTNIVSQIDIGTAPNKIPLNQYLGNLAYQNASSIAGPVGVGGNLNFLGTAQRITGDFSNATISNRVMFQTSTVNGNTSIGAVPNGTATTSNVRLHTTPDPTNTSYAELVAVGGTDARFTSGILGTGTYLPMTFYTGGSERMRVDTLGNVGIGTSSPGAKLQVQSGTLTNPTWAASDVVIAGNSTGNSTFYQTLSDTAGGLVFSTPTTRAKSLLIWNENNGNMSLTNGATGSIIFTNNGSERMRIDSSGNVLVTSAAGLGYGTGSGGTVTQATSKSTAVTLNKPTGQITMSNAALAAGASVNFIFTNSLITSNDIVVVTLKGATYVSVGAYRVQAEAANTGQCYINITNQTAGSLSEAVVINFAIIKGATS